MRKDIFYRLITHIKVDCSYLRRFFVFGTLRTLPATKLPPLAFVDIGTDQPRVNLYSTQEALV